MTPISGVAKGERFIVGAGEIKTMPLRNGEEVTILGLPKGGIVDVNNADYATNVTVKLNTGTEIPKVVIKGDSNVQFKLHPGQKMEIEDEDVRLKGI